MTKQEQIEFIKQKCVEANPSIMDLVFGCSINRPYNMYRYGGVIIGEDNGSYYVMYDSISQEIITMHDIQDDEILGRDIRLDDCALIVTEGFLLSLILNWENGYIQDQTDELLKLIIENIK